MTTYQNTPKRMDNYENATLTRIRLSTMIICTKSLETQISAVGSPPKVDMIYNTHSSSNQRLKFKTKVGKALVEVDSSDE